MNPPFGTKSCFAFYFDYEEPRILEIYIEALQDMDPHPLSQQAWKTHKSRTRNSGGVFKVRNDFMDSYIIIDVPTKLKKSCCNSKRASVIQVLACSALCLCYLNLPNKIKYYNDITLSVTQHFWRPLGPKGQISRYHRLQNFPENCQFATLLCKILLWN